MTNIVLLVRDRPRLTEQTLRTLFMHTPLDSFNLTIVDDGSWPETAEVIKRYRGYSNVEVLTLAHAVGIVGFLRNVGAWVSERKFGRGEWLYFSDNDIAFTPGWLEKMIERLQTIQHLDIRLLGGYQHPYHTRMVGAWVTAMLEDEKLCVVDAVAGYSHLMSWQTWDTAGPYDQHAKGVCQSEDFALCQKIQKKGGYVAYTAQPVIHNCGLTNSEGKPAVGAELFPRVPGLVYE